MVADVERLRSFHPDLFTRLRSNTASAHRALEQRLTLLKPPISAQRFVRALIGFAGFHRCWEPKLATLPLYAPLAGSRRRLPLLRRDLAHFGFTAAEFDSLPCCEQAADLLTSPTHAMGSLYVMEGSTLGGAVISRALSGEPWLPEGGLHYFSPPERDVRGDWRQLEVWASENWPEHQWASIEAGACATFALLTAWMGDAALT